MDIRIDVNFSWLDLYVPLTIFYSTTKNVLAFNINVTSFCLHGVVW